VNPLFRWLQVAIWMAVIFVFSSQSQLWRPPSDVLNYILHKSAHITEYAVLGILLFRAMHPRVTAGWQRIAFLAALVSFLYALTDEFHQYFTPRRGPSFIDVGYDTVGALLGVLLYRWRNK